ncbi:hypothetical protein [Deinococcus sp. NW-56]|uniref:hypothetical protein n=1 Tax=Deinococcus sp. NW-56 TaxID=2080419 RepID=UPI000CF5169A|nr:hypothetical protein [Deinococcus sp. NW-56]
MTRIGMVVLLLAGVATAQSFRITPARIGADEVRKDTSKEFAEGFHYGEIEKAYPYVSIKGLRQPPGNNDLISNCKVVVRNGLKTPSVAKFAKVNKPVYSTVGGVYVVSGEVDSQNSYGAMIRSKFWCSSAFQGTAKGGTLYTIFDVYSR